MSTTTARSASAPHARSAALPVELTAFVGRAREVGEIERLLEAGRLLTLTGAGGSGKTRLAVEVAGRVADGDPAAVAWVELAALADPDRLPRQIAATLGVPEEGDRSAEDALEDALRNRSLLLVLDNCEHLAHACARLVHTLLRGCPGLRILATSREALGVAGERAWLVPPLSVPDPRAAATPEQLGEYEAVQLFLSRARDALPSFRIDDANGAAIAQICHRLDGLPLAIELAAARVRVLPPRQLSQRLDNVFTVLTSSSRTALPRHRTLRATIDWSYQLLSPPERRLLERLAVFAGGCDLDAVESTCAGDGIEPHEVLDLLGGLVDRSLVVMREHGGHARYSLLEVVRQYGQERRAADPAADTSARWRHAAHYAGFAEGVLPHLERTSSHEAVERLRVEQENFRAALHWSLTEGHDLALAVRLVGALWRYWFHANLWTEGAAWCEAMVAAGPGRQPGVDWVRTLIGAGVLAYLARDPGRSRVRLEEAESMARAMDHRPLLAMTCYRLAHLFCDLGEAEIALARAEEAVRLAREADDPGALAEVLVYGLAFVHRVQGRPELADAAFAEAESAAHGAGAHMALTEAHMGRAMLALQRSDLSGATTHAAQAVDAASRLGDDWYLSRALLVAAAAAAHGNDAARAASLLGRGSALREAAGTQVFPHEQRFYEKVVGEVRVALGADRYERGFSEGAELPEERVAALLRPSPPAPGSGPRSDAGPASERGSASIAGPAEAAASAASSTGAVASEATTPPDLRVLALGPLEVHREGHRIADDAWPFAKPKELLVYLMLHPAGRTREQIGNALWPQATPRQVKNSFHVALHHLRKTLGRPDWVVIEGDRYRLRPTLHRELDAERFERAARHLLQDAAADPDAIRTALALHRGDLLEGEVVGAWVEEHRDRIRRLHVDLTLALGEWLDERGDHAGAAELYHALVAREDLNEEVHRRLMRSWALDGQRVRALRHYDRLVTLLHEELDTGPEPETAEVYERLRGVQSA